MSDGLRLDLPQFTHFPTEYEYSCTPSPRESIKPTTPVGHIPPSREERERKLDQFMELLSATLGAEK